MIFHRPDPNNFAGAEARRSAYNERSKRLEVMAAKPLPRLVLEVAVKTAVIFAAAGVLFWLLSIWRGY